MLLVVFIFLKIQHKLKLKRHLSVEITIRGGLRHSALTLRHFLPTSCQARAFELFYRLFVSSEFSRLEDFSPFSAEFQSHNSSLITDKIGNITSTNITESICILPAPFPWNEIRATSAV